jgi:hypothetical protein
MAPVMDKTIAAYQGTVNQTCGGNTLINGPIGPSSIFPSIKFLKQAVRGCGRKKNTTRKRGTQILWARPEEILLLNE